MSKKIPAKTLLTLTNAQVAEAKAAAFKTTRNIAALKACRTMATNKLRGATAAVRKDLKARVADYDRRIAAAA